MSFFQRSRNFPSVDSFFSYHDFKAADQLYRWWLDYIKMGHRTFLQFTETETFRTESRNKPTKPKMKDGPGKYFAEKIINTRSQTMQHYILFPALT